MSDHQKVLFRQAQVAGLGVVILVFGLFTHHPELVWIGAGVLVFGLVRFFLLKKLTEHTEEGDEANTPVPPSE